MLVCSISAQLQWKPGDGIFFVSCCVPGPSCCRGHQVDRPFVIVCFVYQVHPVVTGTKWTGILLSCAVCNKCTLLPWARGDYHFIILCCVYQVLPVATATKWTGSLPSCAASVKSTLETRRPAGGVGLTSL